MGDVRPRIVRVAVLVVDTPDPGSIELAEYGPFHFGIEFKNWLNVCPHLTLEWTNFDSLHGQFPALPGEHDANGSKEHTAYDLYMITGSHSGTYEQHQWIRDLEAWVRRADAAKAPLVGICFGHQVIATALGGDCTVNPKGWEMGAHTFPLNSIGKAILPGKEQLHLLYTHQDAVVRVPETMQNIGGNDKTDCQGMCKDHHIFTLQGHPEFGPITLERILAKKLKTGIIDQTTYDSVAASLNDKVDSNYLACASLHYLNLHPELP